MLLTKPDTQTEKVVLIIDDEDMNFFSLAAVLKSRKVKCLSAVNVPEAVANLMLHPEVAVILMDVMMPGMDGIEATKSLKADPRFSHIPIVTLTANDSSEIKAQCLAAGANDFLTKPVDVDALMLLLNKYNVVTAA